MWYALLWVLLWCGVNTAWVVVSALCVCACVCVRLRLRVACVCACVRDERLSPLMICMWSSSYLIPRLVRKGERERTFEGDQNSKSKSNLFRLTHLLSRPSYHSVLLLWVVMFRKVYAQSKSLMPSMVFLVYLVFLLLWSFSSSFPLLHRSSLTCK